MYKISVFVGTAFKSQNFYVIMENVFFEYQSDLMYDIKGCMRKNIKISDSNIFDDSQIIQNLCKNPIFVEHKFLSNIHHTLKRDTRFLEENFVIDYSLIVGIDNSKMEIKMAIIDYLRKYTWDKRLESAVKSKIMIATSSGRTPTIISPVEYRMRFMDAIKLYFFPTPGKWDYLEIMKNGSKSDVYYINTPETEKHYIPRSNNYKTIKDVYSKKIT